MTIYGETGKHTSVICTSSGVVFQCESNSDICFMIGVTDKKVSQDNVKAKIQDKGVSQDNVKAKIQDKKI